MSFSMLISTARRRAEASRVSRVGRRRPELFVEQLEVRTVPTVVQPVPTGLVDVISDNKANSNAVSNSDFRQDLQAISESSISGVAYQIDWKHIETFTPATTNTPAKVTMHWNRLDKLFSAADKAHKWVQLLIFPGFWSPPGVLAKRNNVVTDMFHVQYGQQDHNDLLPLPMPWDSTYLGDWTSFLKQVSKRYGNNHEFRMIAAAGPTSVSDEFTEPEQDNSKENETLQWQNDGYSQSRYNAAWQSTLDVYAKDFRKQYVSLSIGQGVSTINADGRAVSGSPAEQTQEVLDNATATRTALFDEGSDTFAKGQFVYQASSLIGQPHRKPTVQAALGALISENGHVVTGFQLGSSAEKASAKQGAAGDPAVAMALSIDNGMQLNTNGQHVDFIEVHSEDVEAVHDGTDPAMEAVLGWAASLFSKRSALNVVMTSLTEGETNSLTAVVNVTFSEPVSDFSRNDLRVNNGFVDNFNGSGNSYSFTLHAVAPNVFAQVFIPANTVIDQNGNENTAAPVFELEYILIISHPKPPPHPM